MSFTIHQACAPIFVRALTNMSGFLDKAAAAGLDEASLMEARLAPDMKPLPFQFQSASDSAKGCIARLAGIEPPAMADTETSFAELKDRCARTIAFIQSVDPAALDGAEDREVVLRFPGTEMKFTGAGFLTGFALPNFMFHVTTAYAILRHAGAPLGKLDFLGSR